MILVKPDTFLPKLNKASGLMSYSDKRINHKVRIICIVLDQIRSNGKEFGLLEFGILFF